jgi:hypothetical protein
LKVNGVEAGVVPLSPLAMASNMDKLSEVLQFLQIAQSLGPVGQTLLKTEAVGDYIADHMGVPASVRTTPEEREQIQAQLVQAAQAAAQEQGLQ